MKIVLIINRLGIGGAERLVVDDANELYRRKIPFTVVTLKREHDNSYVVNCNFPESNRICIPFTSLFDVRSWNVLIQLLRRQQPDVVITHLWFSNTIGRIAALWTGVPSIISFEHNVYDRVKSWKQFFVDWILQAGSTRIVAVSKAVGDSIISHGISARRVVVIGNGIDLSRYRGGMPGSIRDELNIGDAFVFLYAGRLVHQKGVDILLDAFARVDTGYLLIAGEGIDGAALKEQARTRGLDHRVSFLGIRSDIPSLMKASDCFVLPSRHEGMPMVVIEALASGMPVIVSDFSSAREMIQDGVSGLIVPLEDVVALAKAMNRISDDASLCRVLRENARAESERFSIQTHVDVLLRYLLA